MFKDARVTREKQWVCMEKSQLQEEKRGIETLGTERNGYDTSTSRQSEAEKKFPVRLKRAGGGANGSGPAQNMEPRKANLHARWDIINGS